jgi:hypothetical protein
MEALLKATEIRAALIVEGDDLAVEDGGTRAEKLTDLAKLRKGLDQVLIVSSERSDTASFDVDDGADAIPFELIGPTLIGGRESSG